MKTRSILLLLLAEVAAMSLWFVSAAMLLYMVREVGMSPLRQAALSSGVQGGFVIGAVLSALFGLADRFDPRRLFAFSAVSAGLINLSLVSVVPGSAPAIAARVLTGLLLAGVYPLGMKIAVGWGDRDRGFLVGALVGALTLGSAPPHLMALGGGTDWRLTVTIASAGAIVAGLLCLRVGLGPFHAAAAAFNPRVISTAWKDHRIRLAYVGYLGHMWELYAMWAWVGAAAAASCGISLGDARAQWLARLTAFVVIGAGGSSCALSGWVADRIGKAEVTIIAMVVSGLSALATAPTFGGPVWITFTIIVIWGISVILDSAQFSAIVADLSPPDQAGSLMTLQTALGFALTFLTVKAPPFLADLVGWPPVLAGLALVPLAGIVAMARLRRLS